MKKGLINIEAPSDPVCFEFMHPGTFSSVQSHLDVRTTRKRLNNLNFKIHNRMVCLPEVQGYRLIGVRFFDGGFVIIES